MRNHADYHGIGKIAMLSLLGELQTARHLLCQVSVTNRFDWEGDDVSQSV